MATLPVVLWKLAGGTTMIGNEYTERGFIVHVDRSAPLGYPFWVQKIMHPDLTRVGPITYNLAKDLAQWFHVQQIQKSTTGHNIYQTLKKRRKLRAQLSILDLRAIKQKGVKVFRKRFGNMVLFGWKSVAQGREDKLYVASIRVLDDKVIFLWRCLDNKWYPHEPALHFLPSTIKRYCSYRRISCY